MKRGRGDEGHVPVDACASDSNKSCGDCTDVPMLPQSQCTAFCVQTRNRCKRVRQPGGEMCAQHRMISQRIPGAFGHYLFTHKPLPSKADISRRAYSNKSVLADQHPYTGRELTPMNFLFADRYDTDYTFSIAIYRINNLYYAADETYCGKFYFYEPTSHVHLRFNTYQLFPSKVVAYLWLRTRLREPDASYIEDIHEVDHWPPELVSKVARILRPVLEGIRETDTALLKAIAYTYPFNILLDEHDEFHSYMMVHPEKDERKDTDWYAHKEAILQELGRTRGYTLEEHLPKIAQMMLSMDSEDVGTRLYNPLFPTHCSSRCLLEWQKNLLEKQMVFIGQFDHLDAPICKMAQLLDIDIVLFQRCQVRKHRDSRYSKRYILQKKSVMCICHPVLYMRRNINYMMANRNENV